MTESDTIVAETAARIFADLADPQTINRARDDRWKESLWRAMAEAGLTLAWVPEQLGGAGASLAEGFAILGVAGRYALPVPLAETLIAGWLLARARLEAPAGAMTVAPVRPRDRITLNADGTLSGVSRGIPFAQDSQHIAVVATGGKGAHVALVKTADCRVSAGQNLAGESCDSVVFERSKVIRSAPAPANYDASALLLMGATVRSVQAAGALEAILSLSVAYANERVAFERRIGKFQAVQQNLARLAGETAAALAAAGSAADTIAQSSAFDDTVVLEAAAAKVRTGEAAAEGSAIAHQVHGAIGFTNEHVLHRFTLRLLVVAGRFRQRKPLGGGARRAGRQARRPSILAHAGGTLGLAMTNQLRFDQIRLPPACDKLRQEVRAFIAEEVAAGTFVPDRPGHGDTHNRAFSKRVGAKGWIGMTWPKKYGGHERDFLERYVVTEEFRVANAPVRLHFVADRQSGPILLKYAPEHIKQDILPRICRGELCFVIGMSEPGSGSDLFAAKTKATKVDGGWRINGSKIWTSNAHIADYMLALFRTSPPTKENRRHGLTQFLVDMKSPGITVNPIYQMTGQHDFNEVVFDDTFVPDDHLLGEIDGAWKQATSELAYERSGPERFLETFYVLAELVRALGPNPDLRSAEGLGRLVAQLHTLRRMSVSVAGMLQAGQEPVVEAAIVKDVGTIWEQKLPERVRDLSAFLEPGASNRVTLDEQIAFALKVAPKLTIQGGTTEILRGIIARGLGLR